MARTQLLAEDFRNNERAVSGNSCGPTQCRASLLFVEHHGDGPESRTVTDTGRSKQDQEETKERVEILFWCRRLIRLLDEVRHTKG